MFSMRITHSAVGACVNVWLRNTSFELRLLLLSFIVKYSNNILCTAQCRIGGDTEGHSRRVAVTAPPLAAEILLLIFDSNMLGMRISK